MKIYTKIKKNKTYIIFFSLLLITYLIIGIFLLYFNKYQINPDAVEYISIALKYSNGEIYEAINGLWSPLFSILLVPFIKLGIEPLLSTKIISLISGFIIILLLWKTSDILKIDGKIKFIIPFLTIPIILYFAFSITTPDLLSAVFIILGFNVLIKNDNNDKKYKFQKSIFFGIIAGLSYWARAYNFLFFLTIFILFNIVEFIKYRKERYERNNILISFALGMLFFILIAAPWIILIGIKYNKISINTGLEWTYKFNGPESTGNKELILGHLNNINSEKGFILDDITILTYKLNNWFDINFILKRILQNLYYTILNFDKLLITPIAILFLIFHKTKNYLKSFKIYSFFIIFILGYSTYIYQERYFYALILIGYLLAISILLELHKNTKSLRNKYVFYIIIAVITASFLMHPVNYLRKSIIDKPGIEHYYAGMEVKNLNLQGNIAGSNLGRDMKYITYYNRESVRYFGVTKNYEELEEFNIDYYFVTKDDTEIINQLNNKKIIGDIDKFYIYSLE